MANDKKHKEAYECFDQALKLDGNHIPTLTSYGNALAINGLYEKAYERFKRALALKGNHVPTRFVFARWLEHQGDYARAVFQLEQIELSDLPIDRITVIRLHLGRLYYFLKQPEQGKRYLDLAIKQSKDRDRSTLFAAQGLFLANPRSPEAIELLQTLEKNSQFYRHALRAIALNADSETSYNLFRGKQVSIQRTEILYRTTYHKIINEVTVLKSIAYRILHSYRREYPVTAEIIEALEELHFNIRQQRAAEKATLDKIPHGDYDAVRETIAEVAHNIADDVNNELFVIESTIRLAQSEISEDDSISEEFNELLEQLELTQEALNDLKSIDGAVIIRPDRFPVRNLFEKWLIGKKKDGIKLEQARIYLKVSNLDSEIYGDEEKLKSMINELIENAIKHNINHPNLKIWLHSQDVMNPPGLTSPSIPGERHYLKITVRDNGKGIPKNRKNWIFQPLNTTAKREGGSGLGLYIIRQTINKMGGFIEESGKFGKNTCFNIYLPYT